MLRFVLGSGLLLRGTTLLLVRSCYDQAPLPLWTLPGGRQEPGETIAHTIVREYLEETSLQVCVDELAYVSESIDANADLHVVNCTFWVSESDDRCPACFERPKGRRGKVCAGPGGS